MKKIFASFLAIAMLLGNITSATADTPAPEGWVVDRNAPGSFIKTTYKGVECYALTVDPEKTQQGFYRYQGYQYPLGSSSSWSVSTQLYVDSTAYTPTVSFDTGVWLAVEDGTGATIGYPLVGFRNIPPTEELGWYNFDDINGSWDKIQQAPLKIGWNTLAFSCENGVVSFYINGTLVKQQDYGEETFLAGIIFNSANYGMSYTSYYADPVISDQPMGSINPEEPAIPEEPVNPEEPAIPEEPVNPEEPAIPEEPVNPEEPAIPEEPVNPEEPAGPEAPLIPNPLPPYEAVPSVTENEANDSKVHEVIQNGGTAEVQLYGQSAGLALGTMNILGNHDSSALTVSIGNMTVTVAGGFGEINEPGRIYYPMHYANPSALDTSMKKLTGERMVETVQAGGVMKMPAEVSITLNTALQGIVYAYHYDEEKNALIYVTDAPVQEGKITFVTDQMGHFLLSDEKL